MIGYNYDKAQRITLGMNGDDCRTAVNEWLHRGAPCDMRLRVAKTAGLFALVIDTTAAQRGGVLFAGWCVRMFGGRIKVDIKEL